MKSFIEKAIGRSLKQVDDSDKWEECVLDSDYEICKTYPYAIRKKSNQKIISEHHAKGYLRLSLNGEKYYKHDIIALQWIHNDDPEHKTQVDHKNQHRDDNHIENLRWCTRSTNERNKTSYRGCVVEYVDRISDYAFEFPDYNEHVFYDYWFDPETDCFYYYTGAAFREITYQTHKSGALYIQARDENNVKATITLNKFKRVYESELEKFKIDHNLN